MFFCISKNKNPAPAFLGDNWLVSRGSRDIPPITRRGGNFGTITWTPPSSFLAEGASLRREPFAPYTPFITPPNLGEKSLIFFSFFYGVKEWQGPIEIAHEIFFSYLRDFFFICYTFAAKSWFVHTLIIKECSLFCGALNRKTIIFSYKAPFLAILIYLQSK